MASAHIRLEVDPVTRKRTIVIKYESDSDALPHEHEEAHRELVEKLFGKGVIKDGDDIKVERETTGAPGETEGSETPEREAVKQGGK